MNPLIQAWLLQSFILFLVIGSLAGMVVGALLLLRPQSLQRASQKLNRWVSTRHLDQSLERNVKLDPWFYRHGRLSGSLTLLGASYILYFFVAGMDRSATINGLSMYFKLSANMAGALLDAVVLSALLGALCAVFVSLFLLFRPSMLREIEQGANQWLSLRRALKPAEIPHQGVDEYVYKHGHQTGTLLVVGSLYVLVLLLFWFGH